MKQAHGLEALTKTEKDATPLLAGAQRFLAVLEMTSETDMSFRGAKRREISLEGAFMACALHNPATRKSILYVFNLRL